MNIYNYQIPPKGEIFDTLLEDKNIKINRIVSSDILDDELYIQDEDEWVVLIKGSATIEMDGREIYLKSGDTLFIPSKTPHRVVKTQRDTLWLCIHIL
jgi:cupin 2 domain-containing protein